MRLPRPAKLRWGSVFKKLPNHNGVRTGPAVSQGLSETL